MKFSNVETSKLSYILNMDKYMLKLFGRIVLKIKKGLEKILEK